MTEIARRKAEIRAQAAVCRQSQANQEERSRRILDAFSQSAAFCEAAAVLTYLDVRSEVRTRPHLPAWLDSGKQLVIPFCDAGELRLFHLEALDELEPGAFGILEPRIGLRMLEEKLVAPERLDLVAVPGLAFDRRGTRLGYGRGFFDRLLKRVRPDAMLVGLAFDCQIFPELPHGTHDIRMHRVITETAIHECSSPSRLRDDPA